MIATTSSIMADLGPQNFSTYYSTIHQAIPSYDSSCSMPSFFNIRVVSSNNMQALSGDANSKTLQSSTVSCRVYFTNFPPPSISRPMRKQTLLYADVTLTDEAADNSQEAVVRSLLQPEALIHLTTTGEVSLPESLLRERMRIEYSGISDLKVDVVSGTIVMLIGGQLIHLSDHTLNQESGEETIPTPPEPKLIRTPSSGVLQPTFCPSDPSLVAFVSGRDLAVSNLTTSTDTCFLTHIEGSTPNVSAGSPSFIIQEEFDRYTGFWWRPTVYTSSVGNPVYTILYEETDESLVTLTYLPQHGSWSQQLELHRYPKPGKTNADSTLKLVEFEKSPNGAIFNVKHFSLPWRLFQICGNYEYLVRAGWTKNGEYLWVQLANRLQSEMVLYLISPESFIDDSNHDYKQIQWRPFIRLLHEQDYVYWLEPHNCLRFLDEGNASVQVGEEKTSFVWASRRSGFWHLYHMERVWDTKVLCSLDLLASSSINGSSSSLWTEAKDIQSRQLTFGDWEILREQIFVDEVRQLILFEGLREHPLWTNVYAVSYAAGTDVATISRLSKDLSVEQLCSEGLESSHEDECSPLRRLSHSLLAFDEISGLCILGSSNHTHLAGYCLAQLTRCDSVTSSLSSLTETEQKHVFLRHLTWIRKHSLMSMSMPNLLREPSPPLVLTYTFTEVGQEGSMPESRFTFYGLLFTPPPSTMPSSAGFPTIHIIYGGPGVQLVRGSCQRSLILRAQLYCHYGYAVFLCDCRGSTNRGIKFAGHIKFRLGICELDDHIKFLTQVASDTGLIDLSRVAIHGSSYGGYMTLMAAARYRNTYRAAIAGCPVVDWEHYDTGYTERYLGLPNDEKHPDVYVNGCVLTYASLFPDFSPYLLVAHSGQDENVHFAHTSALLQQLDSLGKPYELLYYPASRHRVREDDHLTASLLCFLDRTIRK